LPNYTPNINLKKPLASENYSIDDANGNADLIDAAVVAKAAAAQTAAATYTDTKATAHLAAADPHTQYALDTDFDAHKADYVRQPAYGPTAGGTGAPNAYTFTSAVNGNPALSALVDGASAYLDVQLVNTGAVTLNWDGTGARPIVDGKGNPLIAGKMPLNGIVGVRYNASTGNFQLLGEGGDYGTAGASQTLTGYTLGTNAGVIPGTMPENGTLGATIITQGGTYSIPAGHTNGGTVTATLPSKTAQTYTPTTTAQIIAAGQYLSGMQTILGDANLSSANILSGKTIFGVAGTAIDGTGMKKWASGTVVSSTNSLGVTYIDGTTDSKNSVTVSGLLFLPALIFIKYSDTSMVSETIYDGSMPDNMYPKTIKMSMFNRGMYSTGTYNYKGDSPYATVTSSGFVLPFSSGGLNCSWIAIGY